MRRRELNESVHVGRGKHYAEVTKDCKGKIELEFALTPMDRSRDGAVDVDGPVKLCRARPPSPAEPCCYYST
jgi:hypothetical protein